MGIDKEADMYVRKRTCLAWRLRHVYMFNAVRTDSVECSVTGGDMLASGVLIAET